MLHKVKIFMSKFWPLTIRQYNKKNEQHIKLINKQNKDIQKLQEQLEICHQDIQKLQEQLEICHQDNQKLLEGINDLMLYQEQMYAKQSEWILKNDKDIDFCKRHLSEILFAEVYSTTTIENCWLENRTFSPGRMAIGYNCLYPLYRILDEMKPKSILEIGLGQSTRMTSQYVISNEETRHIVIENDKSWVEFFKSNVDVSTRTDMIVLDVEMIPYKEVEEVRVYKDFSKTLMGKKFDLIFVDAPVGGDMKRYSRIDILGILPDCLEKDFVILVDDCHRAGERRTVTEIEKCLQAHNISYKRGCYKGVKDTYIICSESCKFFATL